MRVATASIDYDDMDTEKIHQTQHHQACTQDKSQGLQAFKELWPKQGDQAAEKRENHQQVNV